MDEDYSVRHLEKLHSVGMLISAFSSKSFYREMFKCFHITAVDSDEACSSQRVAALKYCVVGGVWRSAQTTQSPPVSCRIWL